MLILGVYTRMFRQRRERHRETERQGDREGDRRRQREKQTTRQTETQRDTNRERWQRQRREQEAQEYRKSSLLHMRVVGGELVVARPAEVIKDYHFRHSAVIKPGSLCPHQGASSQRADSWDIGGTDPTLLVSGT